MERCRAQLATDAVAIDPDDIAGVVTGAGGPEAGVWVIAETSDLPTKFARIVVTDDQGSRLPGVTITLTGALSSTDSGITLTGVVRVDGTASIDTGTGATITIAGTNDAPTITSGVQAGAVGITILFAGAVTFVLAVLVLYRRWPRGPNDSWAIHLPSAVA